LQRANRKTEEKLPQLEQDIRSLAEPESQQDPKFQSPFKYSRITAKAMRQALIDKKKWKDEDLPWNFVPFCQKHRDRP